MTQRERETAEKLPYARRYLRAARSGLDALLDQKPVGPGYLFHVVGLLATLRACPYMLITRDRKLSPQHEEVIGVWKGPTRDFRQFPELHFITRARNILLKEGSFPSYATSSEGSWEPGIIDYETAHYLDGERRDLEVDVRAALDWIEGELTKIEAQLRPRYEDNQPEAEQPFTGLKSIPPETIAGRMTVPQIEEGAVIKFSRRPRPWQRGDVIEVFHAPSGRTTLTATEDYPLICTWTCEGVTQPFQLERIDDHHYRIVRVRSAQP